MKNDLKSLLLASAFAGLVIGTTACGTSGEGAAGHEKGAKADHGEEGKEAKGKGKAKAEEPAPVAANPEGAQPAAGAAHECAGKNECKGTGGCKVAGQNECKGQNPCKGKGGCKTT
jgi:hypothetical protein